MGRVELELQDKKHEEREGLDMNHKVDDEGILSFLCLTLIFKCKECLIVFV